MVGLVGAGAGRQEGKALGNTKMGRESASDEPKPRTLKICIRLGQPGSKQRR